MLNRLTPRFFGKWWPLMGVAATLAGVVGLALYSSIWPPVSAREVTYQEELSANERQLDSTVAQLRQSAELPVEQRLDLLTDYVRYSEGSRALERLIAAQTAAHVSPALISGVGVLAGLLIGLVIAYQLEYNDAPLRTARQVEKALELQILAALPSIRGVPGKLTVEAGRYTESYQTLASRLTDSDGRPIRSLLITSPDSAEGKSLTAANLALAFAGIGRRVLIIDANLRTPAQHKLFRLSNREGLVNLVTAYTPGNPLEPLIETYIKDADGLAILTTGPLPARPQEVIDQDRFSRLISDLIPFFEVILIDAPSVLPFPDALPILRAVDGVLVVIDARRTRRRRAIQTVRLIRGEGGRLSGVAFNRARIRG